MKKGVLTYKFNRNPGKTQEVFPFGRDSFHDDDANLIELKQPYFKIRLPIIDFKDSGYVGVSYQKKSETDSGKPKKISNPIIYDVRAAKDGVIPKAMQTVVTETGKMKIPHTFMSVGNFITYMSVVSGSICSETIISSNLGASLDIRFDRCNVVKNKIKRAEKPKTKKEIAAMQGCESDEEPEELSAADDDEDEDVDDAKSTPVSKSRSRAKTAKKTKKVSKTSEPDDGDGNVSDVEFPTDETAAEAGDDEDVDDEAGDEVVDDEDAGDEDEKEDAEEDEAKSSSPEDKTARLKARAAAVKARLAARKTAN
jgi:hypothetical protein